MKRRDFCAATGVTLAAFALPAAGEEEPEKFDLFEVDDEGEFTDEVVGWIKANTTASGLLIVEVHLDQGDPLTWFDAFVTIGDEMHEEDLAWLLTNDQGKGNTHIAVQLNEYPVDPDDPDNVVVEVVIFYAVEDEE